MLEIKNLHVTVEGKNILKGINLRINEGEIHAIMGPNGSGKSTLAFSLFGHPQYKVEKGEIIFDNKDITEFSPDQRAKLGLFLGFQNPVAVPGVTLTNFLWTSYKALKTDSSNSVSRIDFNDLLEEKMHLLGIENNFIERYINDGFSGGEKKRAEILQTLVLQPKFAVLDEIDSGLDIDSLKVIGENIALLAKQKMGVILITHYQRILNYVKPDFVHVLIDGKFVESGGSELAEKLEERGYDWLRKLPTKGE